MSEAAPTVSSEVVEIVTIGLPFCVFKGLVGGLLLREGAVFSGALLAALCVADVVFNLANLGALLLLRRRALSSCTLSAILVRSRLFARSPNEYVKDLGNSLDVLLSFSLVAWMVGLGRVVRVEADADAG